MSAGPQARLTPDRPAAAGGTPVRATLLPFSKAQFDVEEEAAVVETLRSGWIATGPRVERFEGAFARTIGTAHAVGVGSCTAGLHLLLRAAGVGPGDEVITSSMTFPATANAILHCGATPVLADVLAGKLTLDPDAARAKLSARTRAILPVHLAGWPSEMRALTEVSAGAGVALIEDASHALGATYDGRQAGSLADGAAFSFYATKNITTGEGGMITTDHGEWVARLRTERLHGIDIDASRRDGADYRHWEAVSLGWKYNLCDIAAAIGLVQLGKLPAFLVRRRELDRRYRDVLAKQPAVDVIDGPDCAETAAHIFPLLVRLERLRIGRDELLRALLAENIGVGVHFRALPMHRFFREELGCRPEDVPVAHAASERTLSIPLYPSLTDEEHGQVIEALLRILRFYAV